MSILNSNKKPMVSIILSVRNEENTIGKCLDSLVNQTYRNTEIIVIDDESTDNTPQIVKTYPVEYHRIEHVEGIAAARPRKIGFQKSKGEIVFFPEADGYYAPDFLEACLKHFENPKIAGVFGNMKVWKIHDGLVARIRELNYRSYERNPSKIRKIAKKGMIAAWIVRREILAQVGINDTVYGEDTEWTRKIIQLGFSIEYEPSAVYWHNLPDTFIGSLKHQFNMGKLFYTKLRRYPKIYISKIAYLLFLPLLVLICYSFYSEFTFSYLFVLIYIILPFSYKMAQLYSAKSDLKDIGAILVYPIYSLIVNYVFLSGLIAGLFIRKF